MTSSYLFHGDRLDHSRGHGHLVVSVAPTFCSKPAPDSTGRTPRGRRVIPLGRRPRDYSGLVLRVALLTCFVGGWWTPGGMVAIGAMAILAAIEIRRRRLSR